MKNFLILLLLIPSLSGTAANTGVKSKQIECLSEALYFEGRSESEKGQRAIAEVILNRVANKSYPSTICTVVRQTKFYPSGGIDLHSCQFSYYCDGKPEDYKEGEAFISTYTLSYSIMQSSSTNLTQGATHYHSTFSNPYWAASLVFTTQIGDHLFYKKGTSKK
jgi:spore germination cell wall hydrolase CwlJ-like protein